MGFANLPLPSLILFSSFFVELIKAKFVCQAFHLSHTLPLHKLDDPFV